MFLGLFVDLQIALMYPISIPNAVLSMLPAGASKKTIKPS